MNTGENTNLVSELPSPSEKANLQKKRLITITIVILAILFVGLFITGLVFLVNPNLTSETTVARIRDIFIIMMALETILVGLVLVILIYQIAKLTNLLENEIKPILQSTNETISTLRGTTKFLSDNLVEPVIKLNETVAVLRRATDIFRFTRKR